MKWIAALAVLFASVFCHAQLPALNGQCAKGGQYVITQGLPSTGTQAIGTSTPSIGPGVIGSYPLCVVSVYNTGTLVPATIYSTASGTPLASQFTANSDGSWLFFANPGCYDVALSGGGLPAPTSLTDVCLNTGIQLTGIPGAVAFFNGAGNLTSSPAVQIFFAGGGSQAFLSLGNSSSGAQGATGVLQLCAYGVGACNLIFPPAVGSGNFQLLAGGGAIVSTPGGPCTLTNPVPVWLGTVYGCGAFSAGSISGITTALGSGLTGGGTSGTLNLSVIPCSNLAFPQTIIYAPNGGPWGCGALLTGISSGSGLQVSSGILTLRTDCQPNQSELWSGIAWNCGNIGTITGITTATGSGLYGGGTSGTLSLDLLNCGDVAYPQALIWPANNSDGPSWACGSVVTSSGTGLNYFEGLLSLKIQYLTAPCETGLPNGYSAIAAETYLQSACYNASGVTRTITGIACYTDNNGSSTLNATDGSGNALLTGAITCSNSWATGTQGSTTTISSGGYIKFTFVSDGTTKQTSWIVSMTQ